MPQTYKLEQQTVRRSIVMAWVVLSLGCYTAVNYLPLPTPKEPTMENRLVFTVRCLVISLVPMFVGIQVIAASRFYDMENMGANPVQEKMNFKVAVATKYLQNTVEQTILHIVLQLSLSSFLPAEYLSLIPTLIGFFVIGRFTFYRGFMDETRPINRAFGFALTWAVNISSFVVSVVFLIWKGPSF